MRNKFIHKRIGDIPKYNTYGDMVKGGSKKKSLINIFVTILCILCIGYFGKFVIQAGQSIAHTIGQSTVNIVSKRLGKDMIADEYGNINVMIIGYGGANHAGGYLADSIMVASWNKKLGAVTMISVPRDFYVTNKETRVFGRINEVFSRGVGRKHEFDTGAKAMIGQLEEVIGVKIPYYALIDFEGFKKVIDTLGGIEIDVPKVIHDTTYPTENMGYMTLHVNTGVQLFSGERALMYARSRHSTSDFDRSLRQQQIMKAIVTKFMQQGLKPTKIKQLYADYTAMVKTNISLDEMIGLAQYVDNLKNIFSFGLTTDCSNVAHRYSYPGCFLYAPDSVNFGGASVILPVGSDKANPSNYQYINNFAFYVMHNQEYLIENPQITIWNGIDKQYAQQQKVKTDGHANQVAVKLKKYAFNIPVTKNAPSPYLQTELYILGTGNYDNTINMLKSLVAIDNVVPFSERSPEEPFIGPEEIYQEQLSGTELLLILGNKYVDRAKGKRFDYYK
ncbi:cell envelope-related transcriptional attenuator [candidate division SR1 bacterium RAAC1_SR1_1]|nr:cell envelope-related transcriptional attenuator [candidate division SR1 bacterium RAAC1_SR1_1]